MIAATTKKREGAQIVDTKTAVLFATHGADQNH